MKIGRLERLIRRMLAESNAEPIHVHDVLVRAYPNVRPLHRALARDMDRSPP
jgi:hypothetical protein